MSKPPSTEPILDIDTLVRRKIITIDKQRFELRNAGELSELARRRMKLLTERMEAIEAAIETTSGEEGDALEGEYKRISRTLVSKVVVDLPTDVAERLEPGHTLQIAMAFSGLLSAVPKAGAKKAARAKRTTGARSSRS